jgi:hypothetical protein
MITSPGFKFACAGLVELLAGGGGSDRHEWPLPSACWVLAPRASYYAG